MVAILGGGEITLGRVSTPYSVLLCDAHAGMGDTLTKAPSHKPDKPSAVT